jgi:hypothetical protein
MIVVLEGNEFHVYSNLPLNDSALMTCILDRVLLLNASLRRILRGLIQANRDGSR